MECASCNQNDFITKCSERETFGYIRGMRGGIAKVRLGLAHHLHQIEYAMNCLQRLRLLRVVYIAFIYIDKMKITRKSIN